MNVFVLTDKIEFVVVYWFISHSVIGKQKVTNQSHHLFNGKSFHNVLGVISSHTCVLTTDSVVYSNPPLSSAFKTVSTSTTHFQTNLVLLVALFF